MPKKIKTGGQGELIKELILQNLKKYNQISEQTILGKLIAIKPEIKGNIQEAKKEIEEKIKEIKKLTKQEKEKLIAQLPQEEKPKEEHDLFAFLNIKPGEKIVTAFPPEPSKYPHIGHAKALLLNYELAKRHKGTFYIRFEDTNPKLAKKEFYDIHLKDYAWLGIKPDKVIYVSDYIKEMYQAAEKLIEQYNAYICECPQESIKQKRMKGEPCEHRERSKEENKGLWKKMLTQSKAGTTLRLKGDLRDNNTAFRDPTLFRVIIEKHPRTGSQYHVWPTYDFENAMMDGFTGITHRLRSKEFELRKKVQQYIQELLGYKPTKIVEFARFNLEGVESSGRIIREKIEKGELLGWDDPSLTTLCALRRRGFTPEAIKEFVLSTGISKAGGSLSWGDLYAKNRSVLDSITKRLFFVANPQKITIKKAPSQKAKLPFHPQKNMGFREMTTDDEFYVEDNVEKGMFRFMHLFNFKDLTYHSDSYDPKLQAKLVHWLPVHEKLINVEVVMPDKTIQKGLGEPAMKTLKVGEVIQFERKFFCKLDRKDKEAYVWYYTHP